MKRWGFGALLLALIGALNYRAPAPPTRDPVREPATAPSKIDVAVAPELPAPETESRPAPEPQRRIAQVPRPKGPAPARARVTDDLNVALDEDFSVGAHALARDVRVLPVERWDEAHGDALVRANGLVYFRPSHEDAPGWPVAYSPVNRSFYPVSHVLHVTGAEPRLRSALKSTGLKEFYYNSRLRLLSLESTPEKVLLHYQQLRSQGLRVRLEVLREMPVAK